MFQTQEFYNNYAYLKKLGNSYKLIHCNQVKIKGLETLDSYDINDNITYGDFLNKKSIELKSKFVNYSSENNCISANIYHSNEEKLKNNISRARNKILEYVLCNDFVYFVTLTLNPDLYDRSNLNEFIKKLGKFINNYNNRKNGNIKYLFIPEQHEDGCWHMHGFIMGINDEHLIKYNIHCDRKLPMYIVNKVKNGYDLYYFDEFEKKFGFNIFEKIRNKKASVLYMSKYLTKVISRNVTELGNHLYYCSKGLNKAEIIKQGQFLDYYYEFQFKNEYGGQSFFDELSDQELIKLKSKIGGKPLIIDDYRNGYRIENGWISYCDNDTGEIIGDYPKDLIG